MTRIIRPGGLARDPYYFYHLSERCGFVLVSICKNACSAQKRWLFEAEGKEPGGDIHQAAFAQFSLLNKAPAVQQHTMEKLPIIAFLRDPFLRLASAYCNKLVSTLNHPSATAIEGVAVRRGVRLVRDTTVPFGGGSDQFSACSQIDYARGISFREFVEYIAATPDIELDPHWRSQSWYLAPMLQRASTPDAPQTVVLPMDRIHDILGQIGQSSGVNPPPQHTPATSDFSPAERDLSDTPSQSLRGLGRRALPSELFDQNLIEKVGSRFANDIALWERVTSGSAASRILEARASCTTLTRAG